jgi:hypothetical protein
VYGNIYEDVIVAEQALIAIEETQLCLISLSPVITPPLAAEIGGSILPPGIYTTGSSLSISTLPLTLNGNGNSNAYWIFHIPSTLLVGVSAQVLLVNGALPGNVYWLVGSSATLGVGSIMVGNIIATSSITINTNVHLSGRAFALTAAVTLDTDTIVAGPCSINLCPSS